MEHALYQGKDAELMLNFNASDTKYRRTPPPVAIPNDILILDWVASKRGDDPERKLLKEVWVEGLLRPLGVDRRQLQDMWKQWAIFFFRSVCLTIFPALAFRVIDLLETCPGTSVIVQVLQMLTYFGQGRVFGATNLLMQGVPPETLYNTGKARSNAKTCVFYDGVFGTKGKSNKMILRLGALRQSSVTVQIRNYLSLWRARGMTQIGVRL